MKAAEVGAGVEAGLEGAEAAVWEGAEAALVASASAGHVVLWNESATETWSGGVGMNVDPATRVCLVPALETECVISSAAFDARPPVPARALCLVLCPYHPRPSACEES